MGWKAVKAHYGIKHIVAVYPKKGLCIGSGYVHDLICISESDRKPPLEDRKATPIGHNLTIWRPTYVGRGEPFDGLVKAMQDDPATLRRLIDAPDAFEASIAVYTYDHDGNIIEKVCEEPGWPNVTHDGLIMYENTYSTDKAEIVARAKLDMRAWVRHAQEHVDQAEKDLADRQHRLHQAITAKLKLDAEFPDIDPSAVDVGDDEDLDD